MVFKRLSGKPIAELMVRLQQARLDCPLGNTSSFSQLLYRSASHKFQSWYQSVLQARVELSECYPKFSKAVPAQRYLILYVSTFFERYCAIYFSVLLGTHTVLTRMSHSTLEVAQYRRSWKKLTLRATEALPRFSRISSWGGRSPSTISVMLFRANRGVPKRWAAQAMPAPSISLTAT